MLAFFRALRRLPFPDSEYTLLDRSSSSSPLLSSDHSLEDETESDHEKQVSKPVRRRRHLLLITSTALLWIFSLLLVHSITSGKLRPYAVTRWLPCLTCSPIPAQNFTSDPTASGRLELEALFARQSRTLEQASARYRMKNSREPPPGYDKFFDFASQPDPAFGMNKSKCLIDDYDTVWKDFEPFYQLAERDKAFFAKMVKKGTHEATSRDIAIGAYSFENGTYERKSPEFWYSNDWQNVFDRITSELPTSESFDLLISGRDEPRIVFNVNEPNAINKALLAGDKEPFGHSPDSTAEWFGLGDDGDGGKKCLVRNRETGEFSKLVNENNAFLLYSTTKEFTLDLIPILSVARISPCFSDIRVPSMFYYSESGWSPKYDHPNDISWEDKASQLYWRGGTSGGVITDDNYHHFPRFRLIDLARKSSPVSSTNSTLVPNSEYLNVKLTQFTSANCRGCDADKISEEYDIHNVNYPKEDLYNYKYAFDIDGNSFSGRFFGLLRSGSLVFKSTVFDEYWSEYIRPYEHYIPVLPDLSDLVDKVKWAVENDFEAHSIQEAGRMVAESVLTDRQNDCYYHMAMLEYSRLQNV